MKKLPTSTAISIAIPPDNLDISDKDYPVYVLGTSPDINNLSDEFWKEKTIIGINHNCEHKMAACMNYWICLDHLMQFRHFCNWNQNVTKFIFFHYKREPRLYHVTNGYFYKPFGGRRSPERDCRNGLKDYGHTITCALSLAYGLGFKDIRLRGVNFQVKQNKPHYFNSDEVPGIAVKKYFNEHYGRVKRDMFEKCIPELESLGCKITNESEDF